MLKLAGYQIGSQIYDGTRTQVYHAIKQENSQPVILKKLRKEYPSFGDLVQLRHQYALTKNLNVAGIAKAIGLEKYGNAYILVTEDVGGISLGEYVADRPLKLEEFFPIAIAIAEILDNLHKKQIVHKDIKPSNILINPETLEIFLTDFSIASLLPKESQQLQNPDRLEGTLAYISPEQTGRMNRGIDYRTDFYGLGVTFYELLTGQLPFSSTDPMELVHSHIAKMPPPLGKRQEAKGKRGEAIPEVLSDIVLKLMAKTPEERYQSALGLKYDLEKCRQEWEGRASITPFELGTADRSDRFLIPEKLYGREKEVKTLLKAFDKIANPPFKGDTETRGHGDTEREGRIPASPRHRVPVSSTHPPQMILVAGFSGIGKTAVVSEVHKPIVEKRGYFIKGKFDQFQRNIPFSALVQALRDLVEQLLGETDARLQRWQEKILSALGEQGRAIVEVIPELEQIIGPQPDISKLSATAAANRFNLLFGKFLGAIATKENPLVIFLDDLQWADSASLKLIELLITQKETPYLLLVGAYRDNEVYPKHPLMLTLDEIDKSGANLDTITLSPLTKTDINRLIADTLGCAVELALPLTELVYQKAKGNPFFSTQFLKSLFEDGLINFNLDAGYWECDLVGVKQLSLSEDVVEFMASRLQKLPPETREILQLAACIGDRFDLETVAIAKEKSPAKTAKALWPALEEGLILPQSEIYKFYLAEEEKENQTSISALNYKFLHDRVQQAAYSLIPSQNRQQIHLKIGRLLWSNLPEERREEKIFDIVNHLNLGVELIGDIREIERLAKLNLIVGKKAKASTAFAAALSYLNSGIKLLGDSCWEEQYELSLALYEEAAEAAYMTADFETTEKLAKIVETRAKTLLEMVGVCEVKIQVKMAQNQQLEALAVALEILAKLGVNFPKNPGPPDIQKALETTGSHLSGKKIEDLIELPKMTEANLLAAMKILSSIISTAYQAAPPLLPLITLKMVDLSLENGNAPESIYAYSLYGLILCGIIGDIETGYRFGNLALELLDRIEAPQLKPRTLMVVYCNVKPWKEPARNSLKPLLDAYSFGLETGDLEYGVNAAYIHFMMGFFIGVELEEMEVEMRAYSVQFGNLKQQTILNYHNIYLQAVLNLQSETEKPWELNGEVYNETESLPVHRQGNDRSAIFHVYLHKTVLSCLFERWEEGLANASLAAEYLDGLTGTLLVPVFYFYDSLLRLAVHPKQNPEEQKLTLEKVTANQEKMKKWAEFAPTNYLHKWYLVEAEINRLLGKKLKAMEIYDRAIELAAEHQYLSEEALANELAAKFYLEWGKEKVSRSYVIDAYYAYARWGALAKVKNLERRYPHLLAAVLEREVIHLDANATISPTAMGTFASGGTSVSEILDISSALKASQAISEVLQLEQLLEKLMAAIMENAGAGKGALLLLREQTLVIEACAEYTEEEETIAISSVGRSLPLEESQELPVGIINTVKRTRNAMVINDGVSERQMLSDRYLQLYRPYSLACLPLLNRGKLIGIFYLENRFAREAFASDRINLLNVLCSQAAISLENALLYEQSQNYAHKLEDYLQQLQAAQLQLVQSEKMATIGQLVAGIAHEINNPVGFLSGNLLYVSNYAKDIINVLNLYRETFPNPGEKIETEIEEVELDYLVEDLPHSLESMKTAIDRVVEISQSMRTFSRSDTAAKVPFNLHDGIDSTLLILKHRLKANENRPEIEVVKNYGDLPEVNCYPGQLNQVFMNLIANAIDALEEGNSKCSFEENKSHQNRIAITTEIDGEKQNVIVRVADNGPGMSEEVKKKIFDHLFTTKQVGKGTGLGLSISRQIVADKHGGKITCTSEVGKGTEFAIALPIRV